MSHSSLVVSRWCLAIVVAAFGCGDDGDQPEGGSAPTTSVGGSATGGADGAGAGTSEGGAGATSPVGGAAQGGEAQGGQAQGGAPTGIGCLTDVSAGHHEVTCEGDVDYDVEIPAACVFGACGMIVDLHGYTMSGDAEDENTLMRALGQEHGYVVVQPTAPADGFGFPSWAPDTHAPLVHAFLADLAASLPIDPARIHAMGFSQGGGMTFRLLCDHADFFASGAPIGAVRGCEFDGDRLPSEEVDILMVHGHADNVVSFPNVAIPQRDDALAAWSFGAPSVFEDESSHTATRWTTETGTDFEFWEHDYETSATAVIVQLKGHCVPGGEDFDGMPAGYSCEDTGTFVYGELAMQFFRDHPKD